MVVGCQQTQVSTNPPPLPVPGRFSSANFSQKAAPPPWLRQLNDPALRPLISEALRHNQNLQTAGARLRATRESLITARARLLPRVNAGGGYSVSDARNQATRDSYSLNFSVGWEADLWGRLRNLQAATQANYASQAADFQGAILSLSANTAQAWYDLVTAEAQLKLAKTTLASYERALPAVQRGYEASTLRAVDLQFARNNIVNAKRTLAARRLARGNAARNLEVFLGRYPSAGLTAGVTLPELSPLPKSGTPASLLERRPDLAAARADVFRAANQAEAARKDLLPSLSLTARASNGQRRFSRFVDPTFLLYTAAANLSQTVYNGGALRAEARAALERHRALLHTYAQTALRAFREVEAALDADESLTEQEQLLSQEAAQTTQAETRALRDITLGLPGASFLEYLEAQRRAENARAALLRLRNTRIQNRLDLYLALGGAP